MSSSPPAPASFDPLDCRNGVPGDAGELSALARRYEDTAAEIGAQVARLTALTSRSQEEWKGLAADNFVEVAGDLAERIDRARGRYEAAAQALGGFAGRLEEAQIAAYAAVRRAQDAADTQRVLQEFAPVGPVPGAPSELLLAVGEQQRRHDCAVAAASEEIGRARRDYEAAVEDYHRAAEDAAETLRSGRDDDLADTWWDRHAGWIDTALDVISFIALAVTIVAVALAVLATGGTALPLLFLGGSILGGVSLLGRTALWATGNGSAEDVLWELAGVLTFGLGKVIAVGTRGLAGVASRVAARHAGGGASAAGGRAATGVAPSTRLSRGVALGDEPTAEALAEIERIAGTAGGSRQLEALGVLAGSVVIVGVTAPGVGLGAKTATDLHAEYLSGKEAADRARRTQFVDQWSMPQFSARGAR